jgi:DNA-binding SARP family transcriptional activator
MRFRVLGPLAVEADDGAPLSLDRPALRGTLAVLLLHAAQPLPRALLIDALWGDDQPGDAETALRVRIRDLRRALGAHDLLTTKQLGYQIKIKPGELDADNFRTLVVHGHAALDSGDVEDSARLLDQACRLWRDPPLADLPDTPPMRMAATALLEQLRDARDWLTDARLALGQHHEVLDQIRAVLAADPVREHPHVQLMLALYRCGQKAAALAAYGRLRELTTRELGQDPGPEAREMLSLILADSSYLQFRPRFLAASSDVRPTWTPVCQLPAPPSDFTGRILQIQELARAMPAAGMPVTVVAGPPGAGKTSLAVKSAHLAASAYCDGQLYVGLGGVSQPREPSEALGELVRSLGVPPGRVPAGVGERAALYRSILAGRRVLVLADDAASAAQVRPLLPGTPGCAVLVTSSRLLTDLEGARRVTVGALSEAEAASLLGKIAGEGRTRAEPSAVAAITAACEGLPLALRIAGARLAASQELRLAELADALSDPGRLLDELVVGDLSVRGRLDAAWQALNADGRCALRQLALRQLALRQPAPAPPAPAQPAPAQPAPAQLAPVSQVPAGFASHAVRQLLDACLIEADPAAGAYRLAPLVGVYAAAQPHLPQH